MEDTQTIGTIGNFYGKLHIKEENGKYYWGINGHGALKWEEIPFYLYKSLLKFEDDRFFVKVKS